MFYSAQIISKGGPLRIIWIASYSDKKVKKNEVEKVNLQETIDQVSQLAEEGPLALRLTGHLLLGVSLIYNRQVTYLLADSQHQQQQLLKLDEPGRPGLHRGVTLDPKKDVAPLQAVTLLPGADLDEDDTQLLLGQPARSGRSGPVNGVQLPAWHMQELLRRHSSGLAILEQQQQVRQEVTRGMLLW
jgi:cohesin complex subunit SCC1